MTLIPSSRLRRGLVAALFILLAIGAYYAVSGKKSFSASGKSHKLVIQVSDGDPRKWNQALNNARNVQIDLGKANVAIEVVVYGPAIDMLRIESEAGPKIYDSIKNGIEFVACQYSMHGSGITPDDMLPDIHFAHSGVVYLMEKQEQGYTYIRS